MLTGRVMLNHHDIGATTSLPEAAATAAEFLAVSTFLKPSFRIAVGPRTGQLSVVVQASSSFPNRGEHSAKARH